MPDFLRGYDWRATQRRRALAHREVLAKFPAIIVGSSGYHRALANRLRRKGVP